MVLNLVFSARFSLASTLMLCWFLELTAEFSTTFVCALPRMSKQSEGVTDSRVTEEDELISRWISQS